jgi:hypothetical protein
MSYYLSDFADCLQRAEKYDEPDIALREAEQIVILMSDPTRQSY